MLKRLWSLCAVLILLAVPVSAQDQELVQGQPVAAHEVLVKFRTATPPGNIVAAQQALDVDVVRQLPGISVLKFHSRSTDAATLVRELSANPDVVYAEPNFIVHAILVPNDPRFPELYGLQNTGQTIQGVVGVPGADISAVPAWDISVGSRNTVVAVIDTGIDYNHPDLAGNMWSAPAAFTVNPKGTPITCNAGTHGYNAITDTCDPMDDNNHGTHCSGTIGAVGNNGIGVAGVNHVASIMGAKFLNSGGSGTLDDGVAAIEFTIQAKMALGADANVRVLSNSWGCIACFSQTLVDEIARANTFDMLFVAAAGNNNSNNDIVPFYPATHNVPNMVSVAATNNRDLKAGFSNYGATTVHLGAPGQDVLSTIRSGNYAYFSGTSMATPHVAGAATLILSKCSLTTADLKANILNHVDAIPSMAGITITGGRLNVNAAIRDCSGGPPVITLTASPDTVNPGDPITIQWTAPSGRPALDWIGFYQVGAPNTAYGEWVYTNGAPSGTVTFTAPLTPGQYEARYLDNDGFTDLARSNPVTVR